MDALFWFAKMIGGMALLTVEFLRKGEDCCLMCIATVFIWPSLFLTVDWLTTMRPVDKVLIL